MGWVRTRDFDRPARCQTSSATPDPTAVTCQGWMSMAAPARRRKANDTESLETRFGRRRIAAKFGAENFQLGERDNWRKADILADCVAALVLRSADDGTDAHRRRVFAREGRDG